MTAVQQHRIATMILERTRDGALDPAGRLPTERQLAADFGVTRSSIRQGMSVLEASGHVSREVGRGTFLTPSMPGASRPAPEVHDVGPADVMAVRHLLEPPAMTLVVLRATGRDFEEMDRCLTGGDQAGSFEEFESWDLALHRSLIRATHSPLLDQLYDLVEDARQGQLWGELKRRKDSTARRAQYCCQHRSVVEAVKVRDSEQAVEAMRAHLATVDGNLLGSL
jgi:DNA-binding FadR family transcriptional regulator